MSFPLNLIGELVAILPDSPDHEILLPDWKRTLSGVVIASAEGIKSVVPGDKVVFGAAVGMDSVFNGQSIRILKEQDLDFVYEA